MSEDCSADAAGPHPEGGGELAGHLGVARQVLPQAALVHVELPAHGTRVVRAAALGCKQEYCFVNQFVNSILILMLRFL